MNNGGFLDELFCCPFYKRYSLRLAESQLPETTDQQEPITQRSCQESWFLGPDMKVWHCNHIQGLQATCRQYTKTSNGWLGIVWFSGEARNLSLYQNIETCPWFQAASYLIDMRAVFQGVKRSRRWANHWRHLVRRLSTRDTTAFSPINILAGQSRKISFFHRHYSPSSTPE